MNIDENAILGIILKGKYISQEDFDNAEKRAKKANISTFKYIIENDLLSLDLVGQAMAEYFGVPYADLNTNVPSAEQVLKIPEKIATKFNVVFIQENKNEVTVASSDPSNKEMIESLMWIFKGKKIKIAYAIFSDIEKTFAHYKTDLSARFSEIIKSENKIAPEMVMQILEDAINLDASDIHLEPGSEKTIIRYRVNGVLQEAGEISADYYQNIVNYLKVLASLRTDEHKSTQDGAIRFKGKTEEIDIRLSIIPVIKGEKAVLRILSRHISDLSIENLGLSKKDQETFEQEIRKPFGMIIISGPTGSGKTTTLYSMLKKINNPEINITSIEDPVEYVMDRANQIQVNNETKVTFARGLRSIVRQDPDVIFVGEVRDKETAEISINAALTGHLLFTTFHANNAETTFLRLADMGVERFLLASTLDLVVSQRLLRRICEKCRFSREATLEYISKFPANFSPYLKDLKNVYEGKGCPVCHGTGYKGRIAAFQIIKVTSEIQELIMKEATSKEIWEMAKKQGSNSLFEDAYEKANLGLTTFEEVFRVAPPQ
ncbi:MAG TPA: GspE/PulE family protein [Candidatus Moranbacteria bacterium]|nr:GspE/PulE family protein [Candidatus Moranbacteria bacterium]